MADTARNKEIVREFWFAPPRAKAGYLTEDAVWHLPRSIGEGRFGRTELRGEQARSIFTAATELYEPGGSIDLLHLVAEDELVALHCELHNRLRGGVDYDGAYHMLFRLEGPLIAEAWEFLDTAHLAARMAAVAPDG